MKAHSSTHDVSDKASSSGQARSARRDPPKPRGQEYDLSVSYYCTMKPRRVYPLVVEVPRRRGAVPADGPTGVQVALRPIVPGALVVPAELSLDVSRPGAQATFHVTPLALGRLPEARVLVFHDGRQVQEILTQMKAKWQRLSWLLLLLALVVPPPLIHWTRTAPLRGMVADRRKKPDLGQKQEVEANKPPAEAPQVALPGGKPVQPPIPQRPPQPDDGYEFYQRPGTPGEVMTAEVRSGLFLNLPEFPGRGWAFGGIADTLGGVYGYLCATSTDLRPAFLLGVLLLCLALGSWALHRPARVRRQGSVVLAGVITGPTVRAVDNAETLPLAQARELE
jgi:hypothetical protein